MTLGLRSALFSKHPNAPTYAEHAFVIALEIMQEPLDYERSQVAIFLSSENSYRIMIEFCRCG